MFTRITFQITMYVFPLSSSSLLFSLFLLSLPPLFSLSQPGSIPDPTYQEPSTCTFVSDSVSIPVSSYAEPVTAPQVCLITWLSRDLWLLPLDVFYSYKALLYCSYSEIRIKVSNRSWSGWYAWIHWSACSYEEGLCGILAQPLNHC